MTKVIRSTDHARFGNSALQSPLRRRWLLFYPIGRHHSFAVVTCWRPIGETIFPLLEQMPRQRFITYAACLVGWRGWGRSSGGSAGAGAGAGHWRLIGGTTGNGNQHTQKRIDLQKYMRVTKAKHSGWQGHMRYRWSVKNGWRMLFCLADGFRLTRLIGEGNGEV